MSRQHIHYWKCDRAAAFHGTLSSEPRAEIQELLREALREAFSGQEIALRPAGGQGNHRTFLAEIGGEAAFVRVEDGPEGDDYLAAESHVLGEVARCGVPVPRVLGVDATRTRVPFAWQVLERIAHPDLNALHKRGALSLPDAAERIGRAVAQWQAIIPRGYGPFSAAAVCERGGLVGFHASYRDYFLLRLDQHLGFLVEGGFLPLDDACRIQDIIAQHDELLALDHGCLVHKDLALWNILGSATQIAAFIDWDDAISGDPTDDLSLLGCFHNGDVLARALSGYASIRPFPEEHRRRFWLHLLRNMIVKAVIRVGAGYFERRDDFYLIGSGASGADLRDFTRARLATALAGLREDRAIESL